MVIKPWGLIIKLFIELKQGLIPNNRLTGYLLLSRVGPVISERSIKSLMNCHHRRFVEESKNRRKAKLISYFAMHDE